MKRAPKNTPLLFGLAEPAAPAAAHPAPPATVAAPVGESEAIVTARRHLERAGAPPFEYTSVLVAGDAVSFAQGEAIVATLTYTGTGHVAAWMSTAPVTPEGAYGWTTRVVPFEGSEPSAAPPLGDVPTASSEDDRLHIAAARDYLTSVGAVSMHQYEGWITGTTVWFNRVGENGGGLNAWLSYDDVGPARGAWIVYTPLLHGGSTAEWHTWARDDLAAPPVDLFKSAKGRVFELGDGVHARKNAADEMGTDTYPIFYGKQQAGSLFRSDIYDRTGRSLQWSASMNPLRWSPLVYLPQGEGYDVAAFDTAAECLEAWARSADQIIDAQEAKAQREQAEGTAPVCPRCLGIDPGKPGGSPDAPHPGPFTDELCGACTLATKAPPPPPPAAPKAPDHEDPATIAGEIVTELRGALGEMEKLTEELTGKKGRPLLTPSIVDGAPFFVVENPAASPVGVGVALAEFLKQHPVSYDELYDVVHRAGLPPKEDAPFVDRLTEALDRANERAEHDLRRLESLNTEITGVPVEEMAAHRAAGTGPFAEAKAARSPKRRARPAPTSAPAKPKGKKSGNMVEVTCCNCGATASAPASSPAAPMLTALEALAKEGWAYQIGFSTMLTGDHRPLCPKCVKEAKDAKAAKGETEAPLVDVEADTAPVDAPPEPVDTWETTAEGTVASSSKVAMRKLTPRQQELLAQVAVVDDRAIFTSDEHVEDWDALKSTMVALGGTWRKGSKKAKGGFVFAEGTDVAEVVRLAQATGEVLDPRLVGFVPTPDPIADMLVDWIDPQAGNVILEPEAGSGNIVRAIERGVSDRASRGKVVVACYELLEQNRAKLAELAEDADVEVKILGDDFLKADPEKSTVYDSVAMNPPFENRADVIHVRHACRFVKPGGKVAAIVSGGAMFRDDKIGREFRSFVASHGTIEMLPDGSFESEGTCVRTAIVRLTTCPACALLPENHSKSTI